MIAGLTGGIGSGKSTVARLFELLGCAVFYSDLEAKEVYFEADVKERVIHLLGADAYLSPREINKAYISHSIFSDTDKLHRLNRIIHPAVKQRFLLFAEHNNNKTVIKETALLFEAGLEKEVNKIIMVASHKELRINRVMKRDQCGREEVIKKINSQLPQEEKIKRSDFVVYNNEEDFLITQVLTVKESLDKMRN